MYVTHLDRDGCEPFDWRLPTGENSLECAELRENISIN